MKTRETSNKNELSKNGLTNKDCLENSVSSISIAMGLLATLPLDEEFLWIKRYRNTTDLAHLRILLQEVMEEIHSLDQNVIQLRENLSKKYFGICLN